MPRGGRAAEGREWLARAFTHVEDAVYLGLGLLLAAGAVALLATTGFGFVRSVLAGAFVDHVIELLDQVLLIFMIVEILYTVQVSFREYALVPEPFIVVGLIAVIRRLLVLTAERPLPGRVWMWRGDPQTLQFKRDRVVLDFPKIEGDKNNDFGYTWLVPTDKGRGLMFYYHGLGRGPCPIWVADVKF